MGLSLEGFERSLKNFEDCFLGGEDWRKKKRGESSMLTKTLLIRR